MENRYYNTARKCFLKGLYDESDLKLLIKANMITEQEGSDIIAEKEKINPDINTNIN